MPKKIRALRDVHNVEDHPLIRLDVVHGEVEPHAQPGAAGVGPDEEIVLELGDQVHPAEISVLEGRVEADVALLGFAAVTRWSHHHLVHVAQAALGIAVFALCKTPMARLNNETSMIRFDVAKIAKWTTWTAWTTIILILFRGKNKTFAMNDDRGPKSETLATISFCEFSLFFCPFFMTRVK